MFSRSLAWRDQVVMNTWVGAWPARARRVASASVRSAAMAVTPGRWPGRRARAATSQPSAMRRSTSALPMMPLAPTTSALFMGYPEETNQETIESQLPPSKKAQKGNQHETRIEGGGMAGGLRAAPCPRAVRHQMDQHDPAHAACQARRLGAFRRPAAQPSRHLEEDAEPDLARTGGQRPREPRGRTDGAADRDVLAHRAGQAHGGADRNDLRLGSRKRGFPRRVASPFHVSQAMTSPFSNGR